jgi:hypothetical protein
MTLKKKIVAAGGLVTNEQRRIAINFQKKKDGICQKENVEEGESIEDLCHKRG